MSQWCNGDVATISSAMTIKRHQHNNNTNGYRALESGWFQEVPYRQSTEVWVDRQRKSSSPSHCRMSLHYRAITIALSRHHNRSIAPMSSHFFVGCEKITHFEHFFLICDQHNPKLLFFKWTKVHNILVVRCWYVTLWFDDISCIPYNIAVGLQFSSHRKLSNRGPPSQLFMTRELQTSRYIKQ